MNLEVMEQFTCLVLVVALGPLAIPLLATCPILSLNVLISKNCVLN